MTDRELHDTVLAAVAAMRDRLSDANIGSQFHLAIVIEGRLNSADPPKVAYKLSADGWSTGATEGNALTPVVDEYMRRAGWNKRHAPLALPPAEEPPVEPPPAPYVPTSTEEVQAALSGKKSDDDLVF